VAGLTVGAHFWSQSPPEPDPKLFIAPPPGFGNIPLAAESPAAEQLFERLLADPNIKTHGLGLTVVSHGWLEKDDWYRDLALAMRAKTKDPWLFAWYDWQNLSKHINPTEVARLAKFRLGPNLGQQISEIEFPITHVHLIGHSAGSWLINEAARVIRKKRDTSLHLTFLDAFIPVGWNEDELGDVSPGNREDIWADHYLTRDHTLAFTHQPLKHAYNVDLTGIAHGMNRHRFPFFWYHATVTGHYPREKFAERPVSNQIGSIRYGFPLTREAGIGNWQETLTFVTGNEPIEMAEPED
jgi:hypothetical protein